jgi:hypothetical protein
MCHVYKCQEIFKSQESFLGSWPLKMGLTCCPERSISNYYSCEITQKSAFLAYFAAEAWNLPSTKYHSRKSCGKLLKEDNGLVKVRSLRRGKVCTSRVCWYNERCDEHNLAWKNFTSDKGWLLKHSYSAVSNPIGHDKRKERKLGWVAQNIAPFLVWVRRSNLITKRHPLVPSRVLLWSRRQNSFIEGVLTPLALHNP